MRRLIAVTLFAVGIAGAQDTKGLVDDDPAVRAAAADRLGRLGPAAAPAVPQLIELVFDETDVPSKAAIRALGRIGPAARDARPFLQERVIGREDLEPLVANALASIGAPDPEPALVTWLRARGAIPGGACTLDSLAKGKLAMLGPHLLLALEDRDAIVQAQAARFAGSLAQTDADLVKALAALLDHPSACVRFRAGVALSHDPLAAGVFVPMLQGADVKRRRVAARFFRGPEAIAHLRLALRDDDEQVQGWALGGFSVTELRADRGLVLDLAGLLDRDPGMASHLSSLLGSLGPDAAAAVPAFARCLASPDPGIRWAACYALGRIGEPAGPAAVALAMTCFDERIEVAIGAIGALKALGKAATEAAPYLAELAEANPSRSPHARIALAAIGEGAPLPPLPDATELPALRERLNDADALVAGRAAFAIGRLAPRDPETLAALAAALYRASPYARTHAALALQRIGPSSLPAIARAAKEGRGATRETAFAALQALAVSAPELAMPVAMELLRAEDPYLKREAARTAGIVGPPARDALPALIGCLAEDDPELVQAAVWALGRMGSHASAAVPRLAALLGTREDAREEWFFLTALGEIGAASESAVPSIVAVAMRPKSGFLGPATEALLKIGPAGHAALVAMVRDETGEPRMAALGALGRQDLRPPGLDEALDRAVTDPDPGVRNAALMRMTQLGIETGPSAEALAAALKNSSAGEGAHLARVTADAAKVATLVEVARHEDARVRRQAWYALSLKDPAEFTQADRDAALPLLLDALESDEETSVFAAITLRSVPLKEPDVRLLRALGGKRRVHDSVRVALVAFGDGAVPGLAAALSDPDARVRAGAALALVEFGPLAAPAVPALRKAALKEPEVGTYVKAIGATRDFGTIAALFADPKMPGRGILGAALVAGGKDALPQIDALRRSGSSAVRRETVSLLAELGDMGRPWLLEAASDPDDEVARAAIPSLARGRATAEEAVPVLALALGRRALRYEALRALATHGSDALPALRQAAADPDPKFRAQLFAAIQPLGDAGVDLLLKGLVDDDESVRRAAANALVDLGPRAASAVPRLVALIKDGPPAAREFAAMTLDGLRAAAKPALPDLLRLMGDEDASVRAAAAYPLGRLARDFEDALATLRKALGDRDAAVRRAAAGALSRAGPAAEVALAELLDLFEKGERLECDAAGQALRVIGAKAAPGLVRFLADEDDDRRKSAHYYLARIGLPAVPAIMAAATSADPRTRREAAGVLAEMAAQGVDGLLDLLGHTDADVRRNAAWGLGKIGSAAAAAVPALISLLDDADAQAASQAAWALGQMGPAAKEALPALEKMYEAKRHRVIVADAIKRIRGE